MDLSEIEYRILRDPPVQDVTRLYRAAGWLDPDDTPERIGKLIQGSFCFCGAFSADGTLIGSMRALSDGVSDAYLLDLIVDPDCRRNGIGKAVLSKLSAYMRSLGVNWIVLIGAPGTEDFYRKTEFGTMEHYIPYRLPEGN